MHEYIYIYIYLSIHSGTQGGHNGTKYGHLYPKFKGHRDICLLIPARLDVLFSFLIVPFGLIPSVATPLAIHTPPEEKCFEAHSKETMFTESCHKGPYFIPKSPDTTLISTISKIQPIWPF
ncbi:hypothetical protein FKM82_002165 [Ascaphus truei]